MVFHWWANVFQLNRFGIIDEKHHMRVSHVDADPIAERSIFEIYM